MEPTNKEIQELRAKFLQKLDEEHVNNKSTYFHPNDMAKIMNSDEWLRRFLMHHDNDMKEALAMVWESCQWRKENNVNEITEQHVNMEYLEEGSCYVHNRDKDGKLLFIFNCKKHVKGQKNLDELKRCVVYWFERVERSEKSAMITIFFDMQETGLSNLDMEYTKYLIGLCKLYYPNFLNYILILEMPWVLNAAFKVIKAWLPAKGVQKIKFVNKNNLKEYVDSDQALRSWGGTDDYEFRFLPESDSRIDDIKKKVHFADGSPLVEGAPSAFGDSKIEECPQNPINLRVIPSDGVVFSEGHSSEMTGTVRLTNINNTAVTYKIKTTSPEKFRVRPSLGILQVNCSSTISVSVQPGFTAHSIMRDKFLIMSFATDLQNPTQSELSDLWKNADVKKISHHRLKCAMAQHNSAQNGSPFNLTLQTHPFETETEQKLSQLVSAVNHMTHHNEKIRSEIAYISTLEKIIIMLVLLLSLAVYFIYTKLPTDALPTAGYYSAGNEHCSNEPDSYSPD